MVKIRANSEVYRISCGAGIPLMQAMRDSKIPILAICDGNLSCATCHVYIDTKWLGKIPPATEEEESMLDMVPDVQPNSRLSCQIILEPELNGLSLEVAQSSLLQP